MPYCSPLIVVKFAAMLFLALHGIYGFGRNCRCVAVAKTLLGVATRLQCILKHCNILIIGNGGESVTVPKSYTINWYLGCNIHQLC
jgi:hypothetical protein